MSIKRLRATILLLFPLSKTSQFLEQFSLAGVQPLGHLYLDCSQQVTALLRLARVGHAFAPQAEGFATAGASGNLQRYVAVQRGHPHLTAQHGGVQVQVDVAAQVIPLAPEDWMWSDRDVQVQIARRATPVAEATLTSDSHL